MAQIQLLSGQWVDEVTSDDLHQTGAELQGAVKYFTKRYWNLTEQGNIRRQSQALYDRLKAEAAQIDRDVAAHVAAIDRRIAELQAERSRLVGK